jgi:Flp pilus assembly protein TadG
MSILRRFFMRFRRNRSGAVTVEFSLVALPFLAIVFAIIEGAAQQYFTTELDRVTQNVAFAVRNGTLQMSNLSPETLRSNFYCPKLPSYLDCTKVTFSLTSTDCRTDAACLGPLFDDRGAGRRNVPSIPANTFSIGTVGQTQVLIAVYPLPTGLQIWDSSATANIDGTNVRAIISISSWINDPSVQFF